MNEADLTARAEVTIEAPRSKVWDGLVNPEIIERYMMGARVESEWREGSAITWKGQWKGKPFEDRGTILEITPGQHLKYSHTSHDVTHDVTIDVSGHDGAVRVDLAQGNNKNEAERDSSETNWKMMLGGLKEAVEAEGRRG